MFLFPVFMTVAFLVAASLVDFPTMTFGQWVAVFLLVRMASAWVDALKFSSIK